MLKMNKRHNIIGIAEKKFFLQCRTTSILVVDFIFFKSFIAKYAQRIYMTTMVIVSHDFTSFKIWPLQIESNREK